MNPGQRRAYRALVGLGVVALVTFYFWWFEPQHFPQNFSGPMHLVDVAIYLLLTGVLSLRVFMDCYTWVVARRIEPRRGAPTPAAGLKVAFITTFVPGAEGIDLLKVTLPAMLTVDYPHDTWLLDEGNDAEARKLCESLGVHYFTRHQVREYNLPAGPFTAKTKGGNHNAWYDAHGFDYDVVGQIDTDFLPRRDFLTSTLGYFRDHKIGWVATPQIYGNTSESFVARGAAEQQYTFYGPVMRGLSGRQMANMLGHNHVVRVAALKEIRFYAGHLTEDLLTGMRLHAQGWRSVYVPEPLAVGEGPATWSAYFHQQLRWAYGCMDILFHNTGRLASRMPRSWAGLYISLQQGYFSGVAGMAGVALLAAYFFAGIQISRIELVEIIIWGAPLYLMRTAITLWLQRFNVRPNAERGLMMAGRLIAIAVWPIYFLAFIGVMRQRPLVFKVTPKGAGAAPAAGTVRLFRPHMAIALVSIVCVVVGLTQPVLAPVLIGWALLNAVALGSFVAVAVVGSWRSGHAAAPVEPTPVRPVLSIVPRLPTSRHS